MERSRKFFLSLPLFFVACTQPQVKQNAERSLAFLDSAGHNYQGNVKNMTYLMKAIENDSTHAEAYRELSIPYLKRGYPHLWFPLMNKAVELDPSWTGSRGYNYLFFYRDYKRALADFRATDSLTPGFTDFPQAMSVRYLKGLCFLGMEQYDSALFHFQEYIDEDVYLQCIGCEPHIKTEDGEWEHNDLWWDKFDEWRDQEYKYFKDGYVDYVNELIGSSFKILNPQASSSCGCGTSFSI